MKNIKIDAKNLAASAAALSVAYMTATGYILNYIKFADVLNEMFFCLAALSLGTIFLFMSFSKK
jgi:hypothetical protein